MVLDSENRILDFNLAARTWIPNVAIGDSINAIEEKLPKTLLQYREYTDLRIEIMLEHPHRYLDVQISGVRNARGHVLGKLIVWRDITELKLLQIKLHDLATRDVLTKAYNRRHFEQLAGAEWARYKRHQLPLVVVLIDIDHFKSINDTYGHQTGDSVLVRFTEICQQAKRAQDIFARWGGEEFIFLLSGAQPQEAHFFLKRLCHKINQADLIAGIKGRQVTCSLGAAASTFQVDDSLEQLIRRADNALYQAKNAGRNRAVFYDFPEFDVIG
jgi:diguanylate cyclase (GGDEF)-like protein